MSLERPLLETTRLSLGYVDRLGQPNITLRNLDLRIGAGEFVCLLDARGKATAVYLKPLPPAAPRLARR